MFAADGESLGFGCMGITAFYGKSMSDEDCVALLKEVREMGYSHFDTAEVYRQEDKDTGVTKVNEVQIGQFLKTVPRDSFTVATKFFPQLHNDDKNVPKCDQATVTAAVDASLKNLGLEYVDLYYLHRMPPTIELAEEWMRSVKTCVESGKVRNVGLSEVGPEWLRRMHAIHPVAAVQQEWSLITRNLEEKLIPVYKELGIAVVAYSPLARNLLVMSDTKPPEDWRANNPRHMGDNFQNNIQLAAKIKAMAEAKNKTPAQLSLAWIYYRAAKLGVKVVPIPGTTKVANARDNMASLSVRLTDEEAGQLEALAEAVAGARANEQYQSRGIESQS